MRTKILGNKKAQLGLNTVKAVMITILVLSVIGIAILLTTTSLRDVVEDIDKNTTGIINQTTSSVCGTAVCYVGGTSADTRNCALSVTMITNTTGVSSAIEPGNYSIDGCEIDGSTADYAIDDYWNVTGSYTYSNPESYQIQTNITAGLLKFFQNTTTIFAILVAVIIILAIAIIIAVVSRFGAGGAGERISGSSGRRGYGSDTVMGV